ncbi:hypothetical protein [Pseudalkalibacillus caeni]|uniref:6-phosphogluconate dehydrogenase NADP-binding domain-containing protein n=1 Tax=Exobacillus caeni TaxID=2574798 RepID=A0A5R9F576_9BACL|nr:hypothetical protein [Pseudalkalibacillus caeni]TLS37550.1 hypothetical protein FCL54_10440 [Pseudalkalibacillus caeni]
MPPLKIGMAGIGRLGTALMKQFDQVKIGTYVYHPDIKKAQNFSRQFQHSNKLEAITDIEKLDIFLLVLPASKIEEFFDSLLEQNLLLSNILFVNLATSKQTSELRQKYPDLKLMGMKFMGHAQDLLEHGKGLFITPERNNVGEKCLGVVNLFNKIGDVCYDDEAVVEKINRRATWYAIKASKELENSFTAEGIKPIYITKAMDSVLPEVIRSYSKGNLGHFGNQIALEMENNRKDK